MTPRDFQLDNKNESGKSELAANVLIETRCKKKRLGEKFVK